MTVYLMHPDSTEEIPHVYRILNFSFGLDYVCISRQEWENQGGE